MWSLVAVLCAVIAVVHSQTTLVNQCTLLNGDLPINAYIEGCTTPPCSLPQLEDCVIHIVFRTPQATRTLRTRATAIIPPFLVVPYPLGDREPACNFLTNTYCPLMEGEVVQYTLRMFIEPSFPVGTTGNIEFRVLDDDSRPVMCIRVGIRITAPRDSRMGNSTIGLEIPN